MTQERLARLLERAEKAQRNSISPYSNFPVGAALETASGEIYMGCNIESSSYGLTMCAERVAIFKAISEGESEFSAIAVRTDTDDFCPPCGACRQVLVDFAPDIEIVMVNSRGEIKQTTIAKLLPEAFNKRFLDGRKK